MYFFRILHIYRTVRGVCGYAIWILFKLEIILNYRAMSLEKNGKKFPDCSVHEWTLYVPALLGARLHGPRKTRSRSHTFPLPRGAHGKAFFCGRCFSLTSSH